MSSFESDFAKQTDVHGPEPSAPWIKVLGAIAVAALGLLVAGSAESAPAAPADMLPVPGGTFRMGADDEGEQDERPAHAVTVAAFLLDVDEVTNERYGECVKAGKCRAPDSLAGSKLTNGMPGEFKKPDHPVVGVSWSDARAYCEFRGKRLPPVPVDDPEAGQLAGEQDLAPVRAELGVPDGLRQLVHHPDGAAGGVDGEEGAAPPAARVLAAE
jgi:hypothetical protein